MADSKPIKQEVNGTVILPPLVFPGRNMWLILLIVFKFIKPTSKNLQNSKDSKSVLMFSVALVIAEFLAIL